MAKCATDDDLWKNAASAMGNHNSATAATGAAESYPIYDKTWRVSEQAQRNATIDELSNAASAGGPTGQTVTPGDQRAIRGVAKFIGDLINKAVDARKRRAGNFNNAMNLVTGLNTGEVNRWLHGVFTVARWFTNQRNVLNEWIYRYAQDPRYQHWAQPLAQMFDAMPNKIRAQQNIFANRINDIINKTAPISARNGHGKKWTAQALGHYAVLRHIPEANAELLRRWADRAAAIKQELKDIAANPGKSVSSAYTRSLQQELGEVTVWARDLAAHINDEVRPEGLRSAGYTNAEARNLMRQILQDTKATEAEANAYADAVHNEYNFILQKRTEAGLVPPEQLRAFPNFQHYVALLSRNENLQGATNDARRYDPGSYHSRNGMVGTPDDAVTTLTYFANRAATELGMQEFATHLAALEQARGKEASNKMGLKSYKYETLMAWKLRGSLQQRENAGRILDAGGLVVDVPVKDTATGATEFERRYIWFDADWQGEGAMKNINGKMLNDAISSNYKLGSKPLEWAGRLTSWHGQLYTRFSLGFAPIGGTRDGMERMAHMINRAYFADNGEKISSGKVIRDYIFNTKRAAEYLGENLMGRDPATISEASKQYWSEFVESGLYQKITPGVNLDHSPLEGLLQNKPKRVQDLLKNPDTAFLDQWIETTGEYGRRGLETIDKWNDWWQNTPAFSQFITLRENGMGISRARDAVMEMMNMQQRGTLTPYLRVVSPFVTPTVQSAQAFARTLGLSAKSPKEILEQGMKGWLAVLGGMAAFSALNDAAREGLGKDENGNSVYDAIPIRDRTGWIPIALPGTGTYVKFPIGFGPVRLAKVLAECTDAVGRGLMSPEDMAAEVIFTTAKDVVPATNPQFKFSQKPGPFIMQMLTPDALKPILDVATNTNYFGESIANEPRKDVARADQGRTSTDPFWHKAAKFFSRHGIADVPPEYYKHLAQSYGAGPIRVLGAVFDTLGDDNVTSNNYDPDGFDGIQPWLRAIGGTMLVGRTGNIDRGKFYDYAREVNSKIQRAGLKLTAPENKGKKEDAAQYRRTVLHNSGLFTEEEIDDYELMRQIDQQLTQLNSDFNTAHSDWVNQANRVEEIRDWFRTELGEPKKELYNYFVRNSNYYRNRP